MVTNDKERTRDTRIKIDTTTPSGRRIWVCHVIVDVVEEFVNGKHGNGGKGRT
jgi:hypothetical protein